MGGKEDFTKSAISLALAKKLSPFPTINSSNYVHLNLHILPPLIAMGEQNRVAPDISHSACAQKPIHLLLPANSVSAAIPFPLHYGISPLSKIHISMHRY